MTKKAMFIQHRKPILIALALSSAILVLGFSQWATAFQGDLLWVIIIALSLLLFGTVLLMLPGRKLEDDYKPLSQDWLDELHNNDRRIIGSALYRGHDRND